VSFPAPLSDNLWQTVGDRNLIGLRAHLDAVPLAPSVNVERQGESPRDCAERFAVLPMAMADQFLHRRLVSGVHRGSSWLPATIITIADEQVNPNLSVWNLAVEEDETYLAEELIVHNCRSVLVPVPITEEVDAGDFITEDIIGQAKLLAGEGFT
jgi:hypothetical protein